MSDKKPTNKQMRNAIIQLNQNQNQTMEYLGQIDKIIGMYIAMNKQTEKFSKYVVEQIEIEKTKKNDTKKNGKTDSGDIPKDTGNKSTGTEGVRKKSK